MTHFDQLLFYIPDLDKRKILDVGSGKGNFLIEAAERGVDITGIEYNPDNVAASRTKAEAVGVSITVSQGEAEHLPFPDSRFGFLNFSEVVEHVRSPEEALAEAYRVLESGGAVYVSVPSRFSIYDPHFHLLFVNWLPRSWSDGFIRLCGREKDYGGTSGHQRLSEMHYYTYGQFVKEARRAGFKVADMREIKVTRKFPRLQWLAVRAYRVTRPWYFRAFHFELQKS